MQTQPFGYFAGGLAPWPTYVSTIDRIDYSNDTATATPKGNLAAARYGTAAVGARENALQNSPTPAIAAPVQPPFPYPQQLAAPGPAYGYWGGGKLYTNNDEDVSTIDRIDFSNDTATAVVKGPLTAVRYIRGATGNKEYGYFGTGGPGTLSNVDRVDYSNDTATASARGPLSSSKSGTASTGSTSYGYFAPGGPGNGKSLIQRLDYSNDTATASLKASGPP